MSRSDGAPGPDRAMVEALEEVGPSELRRPDPEHAIFIAVPLSTEARQAVTEMVERVQARAPGTRPGAPATERHVRWVRMDGLHLTLRFLGPTDPDRIDALGDAVRRTAAAAVPFDIVLAGAGGFPNLRRPRTLWVAAHEGVAELAQLDAAVDRQVADAGWELDRRPFVPHLTLARSDGVAGGSETLRLLMEAGKALQVPWRVDRLVLFESITGGGPARYRPLLSVPFGGTPEA